MRAREGRSVGVVWPLMALVVPFRSASGDRGRRDAGRGIFMSGTTSGPGPGGGEVLVARAAHV
jgi:hypothetical protein